MVRDFGDGFYSEKCAIFIDGGYLNKKLKDFGNFHLDFYKLSEKIAKLIGSQRLRTYYYDCLPILKDDDKSKERYNNKKEFVNKINLLPRFEVKLGELQNIKGIFKQKKVDVLMSLDIADKCFENQISHAVLIPGDSDFIPSIKRAKNYGAIVHLIAHKDSLNREMLNEVDEFYNLDKSFLEDCKR